MWSTLCYTLVSLDFTTNIKHTYTNEIPIHTYSRYKNAKSLTRNTNKSTMTTPTTTTTFTLWYTHLSRRSRWQWKHRPKKRIKSNPCLVSPVGALQWRERFFPISILASRNFIDVVRRWCRSSNEPRFQDNRLIQQKLLPSCLFGITFISVGRKPTYPRNSDSIAIFRLVLCKSHHKRVVFWFKLITQTTLATETMRRMCSTTTSAQSRQRLDRRGVVEPIGRGMVRQHREQEADENRRWTKSRVLCWFHRHRSESVDRLRICSHTTSTDYLWVTYRVCRCGLYVDYIQ